MYIMYKSLLIKDCKKEEQEQLKQRYSDAIYVLQGLISFKISPQLVYISCLKTSNKDDQTEKKQEALTDRGKDMLVI